MAKVSERIRRVIEAFDGLHVVCKNVTPAESRESIAARLQECRDRANAIERALADIRARAEGIRAA